MSKPLNQIEPGTTCIIKETGQSGTLEKIFYYPTKYEVKTGSGERNHYTTHEISFEGYERPKTKLNIPEVPFNGIGSSYASWFPFQANSQIKHHFSSSKEIIWEMITSLEMYNVWFYGIQRAFADVQSKRYVHKFSFDQLALKPGSYFKIRPASLAPWFRCRIITVEKEKEFGFNFRVSPFFSEYVSFTIEETEKGSFVTCNRTSKGIFSFLSLLNWSSSKSKILQRLAEITPVIDIDESEDESEDDNTANIWGGYASREDYINYAVNMGLQNNMDVINAIPDKPTRGLAKARLVRAKRTGETPPMPEKPALDSVPTSSATADAGLSREQIIAKVVNKALDGDMDPLNALTDKVTRGKAKALIIRINRGSAERPPMPDISETAPSSGGSSPELTPEQIFSIAVNKAIEGDMESINSIEDKATRGKAKALLVKIKRGSAEAPPIPEISETSTDNIESVESESESQLMERLIAAGLGGDMEEINALDNKVLRGKIKAAIVKEKRKK